LIFRSANLHSFTVPLEFTSVSGVLTPLSATAFPSLALSAPLLAPLLASVSPTSPLSAPSGLAAASTACLLTRAPASPPLATTSRARRLRPRFRNRLRPRPNHRPSKEMEQSLSVVCEMLDGLDTIAQSEVLSPPTNTFAPPSLSALRPSTHTRR
jgi:hypothetical protein